ncbi:hypothetical protein LZC95_52405 [Pendulispora brunnea]|uniref:Uncharacterized protein n=1 Tax=Pendulispora brunnea TaxID=2905690 RepID=A0ABZ2K8J5_9BACT
MSIVATVSISGFFHQIVEEAIRTRGVTVTAGATTYIVGLLADFARPDGRAEETMDRPLAFLLDEALHTAAPAERFERLRTLGDGVLYASGFFGDHFEARGVEQSYLIGIGKTAYGTASSMLLRGPAATDTKKEAAPDIFGELSDKFATLVTIIGEVADDTIAKGAAGSKGLLKLYERWLKTGSDKLAQALSSQGLVPTRGPKGVLQ